ncbi:hypothetical protein ACFX12_032285 [Malus domestica]
MVEQHERYLRLLNCIGRNKKQTFSFIKERVTQRLNGWKSKLLSSAGNELFIKVVVQTLPSYTMNWLLLPKTFCDELHQLMVRFWWGNGSKDQKIHWWSWEKMCKPKAEGGLGFRDLYAFNMAVLSKQGWGVFHQPTSLVARVLKARYFPNSSFWDVEATGSASYC